jgi:hypothetical protein
MVSRRLSGSGSPVSPPHPGRDGDVDNFLPSTICGTLSLTSMSRFLRRLTLASCLMSAIFPAFAAGPYPNTNNFGVPFTKDEPWYQQCMRVAAQTASDAPTARTMAPKCNASDLYYSKRDQAVTSPAEWRTVRQCALAHDDSAVLMMLYANGFGVPRNADIAMHYACDLEFIAKAEMEARIGHLSAAPRPGVVFDQ